ncbi:hypothetical protein [Zavarzinia compransoris]|uniref:Uncharacterized protein n=1 Tax=Zavarzinia compransoris TaxID=1264899 RepID=A0A317E1E5_9PROT|nr:hypothetical protein [Zavarzinia compransoris]PWR20917.1 hypothetical protein DKG75_13080 [Zavarzinia compransoris]TDP44245.1 hypothetical protein DES42_10710 [Zavarzinia compransoris]
MDLRFMFWLPVVAVLAGAQAEAGEGGERWKARDPVTACPEIDAAAAPTADVVATLVRCEREDVTVTDELWLMEELTVRIGAARAHLGAGEFMTMPESDTAKPVYSLRGAWTWVVCRDPKAVAIVGGDPARNCSHARVEKAEGACWVTTFGTWRCNMTGPAAALQAGFAPPR